MYCQEPDSELPCGEVVCRTLLAINHRISKPCLRFTTNVQHTANSYLVFFTFHVNMSTHIAYLRSNDKQVAKIQQDYFLQYYWIFFP